jgi:hypothetical protein
MFHDAAKPAHAFGGVNTLTARHDPFSGNRSPIRSSLEERKVSAESSLISVSTMTRSPESSSVARMSSASASVPFASAVAARASSLRLVQFDPTNAVALGSQSRCWISFGSIRHFRPCR